MSWAQDMIRLTQKSFLEERSSDASQEEQQKRNEKLRQLGYIGEE